MTAKDIIGLWPSAPALARDIGQQPGTVHKWGSRGRIPVDHWQAIVSAAERRGLTLSFEQLARQVGDRAA